MKRFKSYAVAVVIFSLLVSSQAVAGVNSSEKPGFFKRLFGTLSWSETLSVTESPRDAVSAVMRRIKYRPDIGDQLTSPEESWKNGYGDCEDIAHAIVELCREKGFEAWVEVFYSSESFTAHAVAMGRIDGSLWVADRIMLKVDDMGEARKEIASTMRWKAETTSSKRWNDISSSLIVAGK